MTSPAATTNSIDSAAAIAAAGGPLATAHILVVDDVEANVDVLACLLTAAGAGTVTTYTNPREALARFGADNPDLVLLDVHMPEIDGFEFLARLGELHARDDFMPVIMLTADVTDESRRRALSAGAKDFLAKPFDSVEVVLRVSNLLQTRMLYDEVRSNNLALQAELDLQLAQDRQRRSEIQRLRDLIDSAFVPGILTMHFQPVVDLQELSIVGAEALSRFNRDTALPPSGWFEAAQQINRLEELEIEAIRRAIAQVDALPDDVFLSINVSPGTVMGERLMPLLERLPARQVVLELTEHRKVDDYNRLLAQLEPFLDCGGRLAVDDAGAGYAGLRHLLQMQPDIIKLDIGLIAGIDGDLAKRSLTSALVSFARDIDATLIAEGIETLEELETLRSLGVPWGQGYLLRPPGPLPLMLDTPTGEAATES